MGGRLEASLSDDGSKCENGTNHPTLRLQEVMHLLRGWFDFRAAPFHAQKSELIFAEN